VSSPCARSLRLVRVPSSTPAREPGPTPVVQGTLALDLVPAPPPDRDPPAPDPGLADDDAWGDDPPSRTDPVELPDPRRWAAMIAQAVVEILAGRRPAVQVVRWLETPVYERVRRSALAAGGPGPRRQGTPVRVRRVRVSTTLDGAVEAVAVVDDGVRCRALALRLEALDGRWLCSALEML
jgi:hypothetical protein